MRKRRLIAGFFCILAAVVIFLVNFLQHRYVAPIIMYHSISPAADAQNMLAVSPVSFKRQMHFLKSRRYNVVSLESLAVLIKERKKIPPKTIAITFDDGYKDNYLYAFGVLKEYNLPATIFIIVNEVGRVQGDRLSWEEVKIMQDSGVITFGSHCLGPEPLVNLQSEEQLRCEIFNSKEILEKKLGKRVELFSYPQGLFNAKIRQLVIDAGYSASVATNPGPEYSDNDIFALKRLRISENAANLFVFAIETSGYYTFMKEYKRHKK